MYDALSEVISLLKLDTVCIDNNICRLHYKLTMFILILFSLLVTQRQYLGDPIDCKWSIDRGDDQAFFDTYCWIGSTYTVPEVRYGVYTGVGNEYDHVTGLKRPKRYHSYYQWVTLVLFFQAVMFYLPRYFWKIWEGGKLKMLVDGLQLPICDPGETKKKTDTVVSFFLNNINDNNIYAYKFILVEFLNLINVMAQIYLTNAFVGYEFTTYGLDVFVETELPFEQRVDPMEFAFPKVTSCNYYSYGPSGTPQIANALCILPLNVFNEKIYIVLWYWYLLLFITTTAAVLFRLSFCFLLPARKMLLKIESKIADPDDVSICVNSFGYGDWFLLCKIANNIDPLIFKTFIRDLANEINCK